MEFIECHKPETFGDEEKEKHINPFYFISSMSYDPLMYFVKDRAKYSMTKTKFLNSFLCNFNYSKNNVITHVNIAWEAFISAYLYPSLIGSVLIV